MQIIMKETRRGCEDGFSVQKFLANQKYDVAHSLGVSFIRRGWAQSCDVEAILAEAAAQAEINQIVGNV